MSRERTPTGNILALARSREEQAKAVEETATSYMPTSIDLETWLPEDGSPKENQGNRKKALSPSITGKARGDRRDKATTPALVRTIPEASRRKRISLYLDDDVLTKIFRVSLEQHEQMSTATHRLIREALKARGL